MNISGVLAFFANDFVHEFMAFEHQKSNITGYIKNTVSDTMDYVHPLIFTNVTPTVAVPEFWTQQSVELLNTTRSFNLSYLYDEDWRISLYNLTDTFTAPASFCQRPTEWVNATQSFQRSFLQLENHVYSSTKTVALALARSIPPSFRVANGTMEEWVGDIWRVNNTLGTEEMNVKPKMRSIALASASCLYEQYKMFQDTNTNSTIDVNDEQDMVSALLTTSILLLLVRLLIQMMVKVFVRVSRALAIAKTLPPRGPSVLELGKHMQSQDFPYWCLGIFRNQQSTSEGVLEIVMPYWLRAGLQGGSRIYITWDEKVAQTVLNDATSIKSKEGVRFFTDTTGGINLVSEDVNGPRWKHARKSTATAFSSPNMRRFGLDVDEIIQEWMTTTLQKAAEEEISIDILSEMNSITARVIMRGAFDYDLPPKECSSMLENLRICFDEFHVQAAGRLFKQLDFSRWMYKGIQKGNKAAENLQMFCLKVLLEYRLKAHRKPNKIIDMIDSDGEYLDDNERVADIIAFMIAGFDTTANTLAFLFKEIAIHKDEQIKLRQAILKSTSLDAARSCLEVKNAIKETLRLHPAAACGSMRKIQRAMSIEGSPYVIPSGSRVISNFYSIHRNPDVYTKPDDFSPDRWINATDRMMKAYMPFAQGKRNCQGQALAYTEMEIIVARVLERFEFSIHEEGVTACPILHHPVGLLLKAKPVETNNTASLSLSRNLNPLGLEESLPKKTLTPSKVLRQQMTPFPDEDDDDSFEVLDEIP